MSERALYEQWLERFNDPKYWNPTLGDQEHFYCQDEQLEFTNWTQGMLFDAVRYAQYWNERDSDYAKTHPMEYGDAPPYPDFRPGSGYISPYVRDGSSPLMGEPFTIDPIPVTPPVRPPEPEFKPGYRKEKTPWGTIWKPIRIDELTIAELEAIIKRVIAEEKV